MLYVLVTNLSVVLGDFPVSLGWNSTDEQIIQKRFPWVSNQSPFYPNSKTLPTEPLVQNKIWRKYYLI